MNDPLLEFYERELGFIREEGREFARRYPKIAARLRLSDAETVEDPHVARLIESFALLCARLRLKMEDEFPEICQSMLQTLYPQYLAPVPPVSICQLSLTDLSSEVPFGRRHRRGERIETEAIEGQQCVFRLCYDTQVLPLAITSAEYLTHPLPFHIEPSWKNEVNAALRLRLVCASDKLKLNQLEFDKLRLFLGGSTVCGNELYQAIMRDALGIALYPDKQPHGTSLSREVVSAVGFDEQQGLIDDDARTLKSYRLLWEFFVAPEKFRFVDIELGNVWQQAVGDSEVDLVVLLRRAQPTVQRDLRVDTIRLGCTPVVNLFSQHAEPIRLTESQTEYRVIPSARRPYGMELYSVDRVTASSPGGQEQTTYKPFHMPSHETSAAQPERYWHSSRRRRMSEDAEGDRGTEVYLTLVDLHSKGALDSEWTLHVMTTCCNRDLVARLPFGGDRPKVSLREAGGAVAARLITPPTPTRRPVGADEYYWRLISHLTLGHLSLAENGGHGAEALREILRLYNPTSEDEAQRAIQAIQTINYRRSVGRLSSDFGAGFCRGVDIDLTVDEERLVGMGAYLFASVLDHFFSLFATINSFTRLTVRTVGDNQPLYVGRPRAGTRFLI